MKITVEHEVPYDPEDESRCIYAGGDFWGKEVCQYHKHRDRTHGHKAPVERRLPRCMLFHEWLPDEYAKCEACRKAVEAEKEAMNEKQSRRLVTVQGHGELGPDEEDQMIAFMEYIFEKRGKEAWK
ncbi:hypothetical protein [Christensenella intestinihominis]|uniref:hypothetical protein n=1 Tax=Christensenella intestinihominis TaxID=1851429 RepID=UPI00155FC4D0|nr:hypothetical protein [Christensenella intestinihominis]